MLPCNRPIIQSWAFAGRRETCKNALLRTCRLDLYIERVINVVQKRGGGGEWNVYSCYNSPAILRVDLLVLHLVDSYLLRPFIKEDEPCENERREVWRQVQFGVRESVKKI